MYSFSVCLLGGWGGRKERKKGRKEGWKKERQDGRKEERREGRKEERKKGRKEFLDEQDGNKRVKHISDDV